MQGSPLKQCKTFGPINYHRRMSSYADILAGNPTGEPISVYISGSMIDRVVHVWLHYEVRRGAVRNNILPTATFTVLPAMIAGWPD